MFEGVRALFRQVLSALAGQDLSGVAPVDLGRDIKEISAFINRLEVERARRVALFDRERGFASTPDTSTTSWLRNNCHLSGFSADRQVRLARQLPELEATQKAVEAGEIGIEHALEIARATEDMGVGAEAELLSAAREKDPAALRLAARELRHRADADAMERLAIEQHNKRRLHIYDLPDGMVGVDGALPPEGGVALKLTLESLVGTPAKGDDRSQQQRNADALMELCSRNLDSGALPSVNGRKPHLMVTVQAETLAGQAGAPAPQLEGAGPISVETAKRLMCDGSVSVLTVDGNGVALDLGRSRRLASEPQRRVLVGRQQNCAVPGCNWEARFCTPHHLDPWSLGGGTKVARMVLLCKVKHHPLVHEGGWKVVEKSDGTIDLVSPWDP